LSAISLEKPLPGHSEEDLCEIGLETAEAFRSFQNQVRKIAHVLGRQFFQALLESGTPREW